MTDDWDHLPLEAHAQLLEGAVVAAGGKTDCDTCYAPVREGDPAGVLATRDTADGSWSVHDVWCVNCRPRRRIGPTFAHAEAIAHGHLAVVSDSTTQTALLVLWDTTVEWRDQFDPAGLGADK